MLNAQQRSPRYGEENTVLVKGIAFVVVYWGSGETAAWPSKWLPFILNEGTIRFLEQIDRTQIYAENSPSSREKGCLRWKYETRNDMEVWLMVSGFAEVGLARPIWHLTLNTNVGKKNSSKKGRSTEWEQRFLSIFSFLGAGNSISRQPTRQVNAAWLAALLTCDPRNLISWR